MKDNIIKKAVFVNRTQSAKIIIHKKPFQNMLVFDYECNEIVKYEVFYALDVNIYIHDKIIYVKINSIDKSKQNKRFSIGFASCWAVFVAFIVSIFKDDTD